MKPVCPVSASHNSPYRSPSFRAVRDACNILIVDNRNLASGLQHNLEMEATSSTSRTMARRVSSRAGSRHRLVILDLCRNPTADPANVAVGIETPVIVLGAR
jgi:hypothetical protein